MRSLLERANARGADRPRRSPRINVICSAWYQRHRQDSFSRTCAVDVSLGGARLLADEGLKPGQRVDLVFKLEPGRFVRLTARVVWTGPAPGSVRELVGLRFCTCCLTRRVLRRWIDSLSSN